MKIAGIVLIAAQVVVLAGQLAQDSAQGQAAGHGLMTMLQGGATGIAELSGFFLPCILGVLLLRARRRQK